MNIQTMHIEFKAGLDKSESLSYPDFRPEQIDLFLNKAIEDIVKQRFTGNNPKKESVEETQKRRDDLRTLTTNFTSSAFINTADNKPNGSFIKLPSDYWFTLEEEVSASYLDCHNNIINNQRISVRPSTHDRYNKIKYDPFNKPNKIEIISLPFGYPTGVLGLATDRFNELITDSTTTLNAYYLRYIKKPQEVSLINSIDCDLSEHMHREVIDYAVNLALENIESPRYQTQINELLRNE
jgi:hypothetical protein